MAKVVYYSEVISGTANAEVLGSGITSTEAEPKRVRKVSVTVSSRQGNYFRIYVERERLANIVDYDIPLPDEPLRREYNLDFDLPTGQTLKAGVLCGATPTSVHVVYECELP